MFSHYKSNICENLSTHLSSNKTTKAETLRSVEVGTFSEASIIQCRTTILFISVRKFKESQACFWTKKKQFQVEI